MRTFFFLLLALILISCNTATSSKTIPEDTSEEVNEDSIKDFREFRVLDSKYIKNETLWSDLNLELEDFSKSRYLQLKPLILEQDIPTLQRQINERKFSYEELTKFYLYRIRQFDRENPLSLNAVISLNPNVVEQARQKDRELLNRRLKHQIFGMPILLKDNINAFGMPTTAGAVALKDNWTGDAFIVKQLKAHGALILGKANLSEWAYYFCGECPSGYSAIGGQTLNPYGRRIISTGGSSSGSGVAVAVNFSVGAIGSETSGSILSPSSQNSIVGLKPTIGLLSRSGIVPISSTLDTPGPMTKGVVDNSILLDALSGYDSLDLKSINTNHAVGHYYLNQVEKNNLKGRRFGVFKRLTEDPLYVKAIDMLKEQGAEIIEFEEENIERKGFLTLLNLDMKKDLPVYLSTVEGTSLTVGSVEEIMRYNRSDSINIMPYGQRLFDSIMADVTPAEEFEDLKRDLKSDGKSFFDRPMTNHKLDAVLSINNYHAGWAAVAEYPALTVPMGYSAEDKAPKGLTFIAKPLKESLLLRWAYSYEQVSKARKLPANYD
jgi:amidase